MDDENIIYTVVVNHEEQYSIWPVDRELPLGWQKGGREGSKEECLTYIEEVWTDMRPLSLRKKMEEMVQQFQEEPVQIEPASTDEPYRDPLVQQLANGGHPIIASRIDNSVERFKESIDRGYVLLKFTSTQGGTEIGLRLDSEKSNLSQANFEDSQGMVHLEGDLTLNYTKVRCISDINLQTLEGTGHLEVLRWPNH